jgi:predicted MPP superfamily phosphohydrolase
MKELTKRYPSYYVTGNHEESIAYDEYQSLMKDLQDVNVKILMNEGSILARNSSHLLFIGLRDALATPAGDCTKIIESVLTQYDEDVFTILLAHRPEFFTQYVNAGVDVVLSGHTHGGQIRFPCIGGIYAPNQGFFPRYIEGEYRKKQTTMFVNRGLGATVLPFRLFNPPDISVIHLYHSVNGTD